MAENYEYDIAIVGAGPAGYVAAIRAAQLGLKSTVIEKDEVGGICLNWGCIPSKAIIHQARIFSYRDELLDMGVKVDASAFDYESVYNKSRTAADRLSKGVAYLLKKNKVPVIKGYAKIQDKNRLLIDDSKGLSARNIILATGSAPRELPAFAFDHKHIVSSRDMLALKKLPGRVIILGGGAIGLEFAYILNAFGSEVTIVEMLDRLLPVTDKEISGALLQDYKKKKIKVHLSAKATGCKKSANGVELLFEEGGKASSVTGDVLLVAVGRSPNTANLGLEQAGITLEKGFIGTGDYYRTNLDSVFAVGDVIDTPLLAHLASKEGELAVEAIKGLSTPKRVKSDEIPYGVYCEPQVAGFGLTEEQAQAQGLDYKKAVFPYRAVGKAVATGEIYGQVKLLYHAQSKEILGAHIFGADATELIHELLLAKKGELLPEDIAAMIHAHPTMSEALMETARLAEGWAIHI
jgi:dihydrolipoamide dehydrogenase